MEHIANKGLILEVLRCKDGLKMGLFERQAITQTVKNYSQLYLSAEQINNFSCDSVKELSGIYPSVIDKAHLASNLRKAGQFLWDHLFPKHIKDELRRYPGQDLILMLDEELVNVPWEFSYDGNDFLCLKFNLGRLIRAKDNGLIPKYRGISSKIKMLILANPNMDLDSSYKEGIYIRNRFDRKRNQVAIDFKSGDVDTVYVKKNLRDYDIVHFAGHCQYDPANPGDSGWILSDGKLSGCDIERLAESLPFPLLIFSNACQSAKLNANEEQDFSCQNGNYTLAQAFLLAGVRHYIGSIRKIEDRASLLFAKEFYDNILSARPIGSAVRLARMRLVDELGLHDTSWGSYLFYGDPSFSFFQKQKPAHLGFWKRVFLHKRERNKVIIGAMVFSALCALFFIALTASNPKSNILYHRASGLLQQGKNEQALEIAQDIVRSDPDFPLAYYLLAGAHERLADMDSAVKYYFAYASASEKKSDKKNLACAYIGLGWAYQLLGDYPKARIFYEKALELSRSVGDYLNQAVALRKLAVWHIDKQEYDKALELLFKSSEINRERQWHKEHRYNLACDYFDIGLVFTNKDDYASAKDFYKKSRLIFERINARGELSDYYFNLGEISMLENEYNKALKYYMKGYDLDKTSNNIINLASDCNMIGELYMEMGDYQQARDYFSQALNLSERSRLPMDLAGIYYNLGSVYKNLGQKNKYKEYLRRARDIYSKIDTPDYKVVKAEESAN